MSHIANYKVAMIKKIQDGRKKEESVIKKVDMCLSFNFSKNLLTVPCSSPIPPNPLFPWAPPTRNFDLLSAAAAVEVV